MCAATKNKILNKISLFNYQHELDNTEMYTDERHHKHNFFFFLLLNLIFLRFS